MTSFKPPTHFPTIFDMQIEVAAATDERVTTCALRQQHGNQTRELGVGRAMRRKKDKRDSYLGVNLALLRALDDAAHNVRIELLASGHEELCGLPKAEIKALKEAWLKAQQAHYRSTKEAWAVMTGAITPAMVGIVKDEDDG